MYSVSEFAGRFRKQPTEGSLPDQIEHTRHKPLSPYLENLDPHPSLIFQAMLSQQAEKQRGSEGGTV
jgi:hypothetical protein